MRYFKLIELDTDELIAANARDNPDDPQAWHSGLTQQELKTYTAKKLFDAYRERLNNAINAVREEPLMRSKGS